MMGIYLWAGAAVFAVVVVIGALAMELILRWIAAGEPDVNGDPERDAGLLPERRKRTPWRVWWRVRRCYLRQRLHGECSRQTVNPGTGIGARN